MLFDLNYFKQQKIEYVKIHSEEHECDYGICFLYAEKINAMYTFAFYNNLISEVEYMSYSSVGFANELSEIWRSERSKN